VHQFRDSSAFVNYGAAEVQAAQREQLAAMRLRPYDPQALAKQFEHGINQHLPDGVAHRVDSSRYVTDEETGLVIDRPPGVTDSQYEAFLKMLRQWAPSSVAYSLDDLSGYTGEEPPLRLVLDTTATIKANPRRNWSPAESEVIDTKCQELTAGKHPVCTRLVESDYACNPILAVKRAPDGTWSDHRFCINFIPINKHTEPDRYSAHRADDLFRRVVKAKYLTALDLRSGYHQIPMHTDSVSKTAFWWATHTTSPNLLAYQRMPFGLKNAPAKFQRVMDRELARGGCSEFAFAYIDDLIIASDSWEEHIEHVARVLKTLSECNLKIHPQKSVFATNVVEYLGHNVVGEHGLTMNEAKIQAIKALPTPNTVPELRSILGFMTYYRHFIPGYSTLTAPLNKLLQLGVPFEWGPEQRAAYATLKDLMTQPGRVLRPIDYNKELILHTDWSLYGIGAVLGQLDEDGNEYLCACISRSLNKHERNYPSYKGELLALAWAVRSFRQHLHGTKFRLVTDHQPLRWLMDARDLNGQYARWQMMLQEYDFTIEHRAGVKHANADVLSRFPQSPTSDNTGTQLDAEVAAYCGVWTPYPADRKMRGDCKPPAPPPRPKAGVTIDTLAPKFDDVFHHGSIHVDEQHYADGLMQSDFHRDRQAVVGQLAAAVARVPRHSSLKEAAAQLSPSTPQGGLTAQLIDNRIVAKRFFPHVSRQGVSLLELCGGICATLETLLRAGTPVRRYVYCDIDPVARQVAQFRVENLSAKYPDLFPPSAWEHAFTLPQDITKVSEAHLDREGLFQTGHSWLISAGWPCQDYSSAGLGTLGRRAAVLHDVARIIHMMQQRHRDLPPGYILENVAMQHNFRHEHIKFPVYDQIVAQLGTPVTFDAAQAGSYAHRLRNYWTNLVHPEHLQQLLDSLDIPRDKVIDEILGHGRSSRPVEANEQTISGRRYNTVGSPRAVMPTLMSFPHSRAFREGRQGCIWDDNTQKHDEPTADERELMMGFEPSSTAAPRVTERQRRSLLGQAIDINALSAIWAAAKLMHQHPATRAPQAYDYVVPPNPAEAKVHPVAMACCHWDADDYDLAASPFRMSAKTSGRTRTPWGWFGTSICPRTRSRATRARKRALLFRWFNNRLFKVVVDKLTTNPSYRVVPPPQDRDQLIRVTHKQLGHVGEKRTIAALATTYWWHGMTVDIRRVLSGCKTCKMVGESPPAATQEMQTAPHDYGLFYRWGLDYVGELSESSQGNKYALICIDYHSKWIEVIPVPQADADTTKRVVLMHLIARYGTPAEFICDNGPPFQGKFKDFCDERGIHLRYITPGMPRSNGLAERAVKTVKYALKKHAFEEHNARTWCSEGLPNILLGYRITPQASTMVSPAQLLFAQDPAVNADKYAKELGPIDYLALDHDEDRIVDQLRWRASLAAKLGAQVATNLRVAHDRNAARFKHLRSGLSLPRVYVYRPGDFVFLLHHEDTVPGGALGLRTRPEILKVKEVKATGVLVLENQLGELSESHRELCRPCLLPNVEGTTHPDQRIPSARLACTKCKDHRKASVMLLCDNCNAPWHTYCLTPPLTAVPDGIWLCPDCTQAGVTDAQVRERQARYIPAPVNRPRLELPSPARQAKAKAAMEAWHGKIVVRQPRHGEPLQGRVIYQGILEPKWFKVYWEDGTESSHMPGVFRHFGVVDEQHASPTVMHKPEPAQVFALCSHNDGTQVNWSVRTADDIRQRMELLLPGDHPGETIEFIHKSLGKRLRAELVRFQGNTAPAAVKALLSVLDFRPCRTVLDPWAGHPAVSLHFKSPGTRLVTNDRWGAGPLNYEPLETHLYTTVQSKMDLDAVVTIPPVVLSDIALVTAFYHTAQCVCMYVPTVWVTHAPASRMRILMDHIREGTFIGITSITDPMHCWVCFFHDAATIHSMSRSSDPVRWHIAQC
jgi:hypothetical protein